jgi:hydroxymethylbilane synthase
MKRKITAGSRGSRLALIQTESVVALIKQTKPGREIEIKKIITTGDHDRWTHLDRMGADAYVKELEEALLDGRIDLAVHSLKDVPTDIPGERTPGMY